MAGNNQMLDILVLGFNFFWLGSFGIYVIMLPFLIRARTDREIRLAQSRRDDEEQLQRHLSISGQ